jgi:hypothetical protein
MRLYQILVGREYKLQGVRRIRIGVGIGLDLHLSVGIGLDLHLGVGIGLDLHPLLGRLVVKALRYKSESPGIDSRCRRVLLSVPSDSSMCPGVDSASKN